MSFEIDRHRYAELFGPTEGDSIRLGDTDLFIKIEKDYTGYGNECKFGGGKTLRDGMGQNATQISKNPMDVSVALDSVGLSERKGNFPAQLSGGEQQRVSIARALAKRPKLLLCDEPTGALDDNTGRAILKLLQETCRKEKMTVVLITHNQAITPMADRVIKLQSGKVESDTINENPVSVDLIEW